MKTLNETLEEIEKRAEAFKFYGTTDCSDCEGRVTLFTKIGGCVWCRKEAPIQTSEQSDVPKLLAMLRLAIEQRNTYAPKGIVDVVHDAELLKLAGGE